jgi:glycosyltransferase involved in cell wall biosynthesis
MPQKLLNSKVSIIVPFYNREKFLAETIESILAQTHSNWELMLVNDGSTDRGDRIARQFISQHPEMIFLYSHPDRANRGASASRNLGVRKASGDLITFLDSDDILLPTSLEKELKAFQENPDADAVCGTLQYWFSWDKSKYRYESDFVVDLGVEVQRLYDSPQMLVHNLRSSGRKPGMGCVTVRRELVEKFTLFEDDFARGGEDQIFWAILSLNAKVYVLEDCLLKYRQHSVSSTAGVADDGKAIADWEKFLSWLEKYLRENEIEDADVWSAVKASRKEIVRRRNFAPVLNLYRKILPTRFRYRIRDWISRIR